MNAEADAIPPHLHQEVMIPMRDGVRLQTVIVRPAEPRGDLPVLLTRGPYGVPDATPEPWPFRLQALARDGYIFVFQNVRGRFKSEGHFGVSTLVDVSDPKSVNEATDAYDTIDWLTRNLSGLNGRTGIHGVSFGGLTAALSLLLPHPTLKAVSPQGASADQWMNDDFHRYGALRLSYAFEYAVREQANRHANTRFSFDTQDTYDWYLKLGPLANVNARHLHGRLSFWNDLVAHPDYDEYWRRDAWVRQLHGAPIPVLNVAGYWDQEDPWGPWEIFRQLAALGPMQNIFLVAGPWTHGAWEREPQGDHMGPVSLAGQPTAEVFREQIEAPFFRHFLHGSGPRPEWRVKSFQTGTNRWRTHGQWPPSESHEMPLYLHADGTLAFDPPTDIADGPDHRTYVSDPSDPVPHQARPIGPVGTPDWETWELADQRFVQDRDDVLRYLSAPLMADLEVTGEVSAVLFASTSSDDCDFVVKLIDVFPEGAELPAGYELPIAMEVRRGRYLESFEDPSPLPPLQPVRWDIPMRDHDHVFRRGHRIMVQVQSSWFPVIDRNPQSFTPNIYLASPADFRAATQCIFSRPDLPSHLRLRTTAKAQLT